MTTGTQDTGRPRSVNDVLAAGWSLFVAGLPTVFPWVLAAELSQLLPFSNPSGGLLDTDLAQFVQPTYLGRALLLGALQAFFYAIAVLRLAALVGDRQKSITWRGLRAAPAVLVAYVVYELIMIFGFGLASLMFMLGFFVMGPMGGLVLSIIPLAPTAAASTALALFIYPAVLEKLGPFAALSESARLARTAWVRVSLVISVPAVVLLLAWLVGNGAELGRSISSDMNLLSGSADSLSMEQLQAMISSATSQAGAADHPGWQWLGVICGALGWWYTLAVCYAQYRDLKTKTH